MLQGEEIFTRLEKQDMGFDDQRLLASHEFGPSSPTLSQLRSREGVN